MTRKCFASRVTRILKLSVLTWVFSKSVHSRDSMLKEEQTGYSSVLT